ncbi:hypothetical protein MNBD_ACTINO02-2309 [hydrothermal vent metagenome]|uniref:Uncharacterized protein n=1 Tax=hydrothermal vent metagenome TaxID=652676 RepID=A0A3B0RX98_9ZZZZ
MFVLHANRGFSRGGFIGVDVFLFILFGYLITLDILRRIEQNGSLDLSNFYARGAHRLLPGLFLVVVAIGNVRRFGGRF